MGSGVKSSVFLLEGHWFDSPGLHAEDTKPQAAPDVLVGTVHGSHAMDKSVS